jgi:anti-anti-sigma regulatory factor
MVSCSVDEAGQFLTITYIGHITSGCVEGSRRKIRDEMKHLQPGFALLVDLTLLETMDHECAQTIGAMIELCSSREMALAVWVIPDPNKDIGMNLIARFHCWEPVRTHTRVNLAEAIKCLLLERAALASSPEI